MGTGVRIAHDDGVARSDKSFFRKDGVTDAIFADIKKVFYIMSPSPVSEDFSLFSGFGILGGGDMVDNGLDFGGIKNPIHPPGPSDR